ncbi:DUF1737 domain-containing protein [Arthrobacter sp. ISL-5]|uniref:DUF1737 domain-containing protein n=1 Tax=Arthrobacter sp. ISL-5 TaxID=2819111 RepID=UPI001BE65657|nr:DUF1737 domain-containing protein [Arthrobacter sp. ISL-5]MBT2553074.1 DUF1737 domain-containing protein [Arthrobacter sp. ISL-5]
MTDAPAGVTLPSQQDQPEEKLSYRLITGPDDRAFCERISTALAEGYVLHGSPAATYNGINVIVAQALVLPYAIATADAAVATAVDRLDSDEDLNAEAFEGHA